MEINRILIDVIPINSNLFKYSNYFNEVLIYEKVIKPYLKINHFKIGLRESELFICIHLYGPLI